jgi:hypothetical protein
MNTIKYFLFSVLFISASYAASGNMMFFHTTPEGVVRGDEAKIEVMLSGAGSEVYDLRLFYREAGDIDYKSVRMKQEGLLYVARIGTEPFTTGQMQYYIGYEGALGETGTLPEETAEMNPYLMTIAPARSLKQSGPVEIVILSPLPDEAVSGDEIMVAVSVYSEEEKIEYANTKVVIDGVNIRSNLDFSEGLVTFTPPPGYNIRSGYHNVEIQVFNAEGNMVGKKEWAFQSSGSTRTETNSFVRGSAFLENRYQEIAKNSDNFFRGGAEVSGNYTDLEYDARLVFSSEESPDRQPVNRYTARLRYNFSPSNNIYLNAGDINPYFNPLVLMDKRLRGLQTGLAFGFFTFDYVTGQLVRGIEGRTDTLTSAVSGLEDIIPTGGVYEQNMWGIRPGFRFGDNVWWTLNLINAKEEPNSIQIGGNVKESVSMGTDLNMNFDRRRILIDASVNASINNSNAALETVTWDTLLKYNPDLEGEDAAKQAWDFLESTGWLSMTTGLNPIPSLAMQFDATFRYYNNNLKLQYYLLDKNFASPGNPYLLKDVAGFQISDNIRLVENQVFLTLYYKNYTTNRSLDLEATSNNEFGAAVSYFPFTNLPSLTVGYSGLSRSNDVPASDTLLYMIDNSTQRLYFNTSYKMDISGTRNTLMLNFSNYGREDANYPTSQSDFNLYGIGLRTNFNFPLTTRINYSSSENDIGTESSGNKSNTTVSTILLGVDYAMSGFGPGDYFKPFINYRIQNVTTESNSALGQSTFETGRNNYTIGFAYQSPKLGILSLRFDQISYSDNNNIIDYSDSILNARYTYSF